MGCWLRSLALSASRTALIIQAENTHFLWFLTAGYQGWFNLIKSSPTVSINYYKFASATLLSGSFCHQIIRSGIWHKTLSSRPKKFSDMLNCQYWLRKLKFSRYLSLAVPEFKSRLSWVRFLGICNYVFWRLIWRLKKEVWIQALVTLKPGLVTAASAVGQSLHFAANPH